MEPRHITPKQNTPLNRLFLSINHYVSTGDHFGEGVAMPTSTGRVLVMVPVNTRMEQDRQDFDAFRARFDEMAGRFDTELQDIGRDGLFHFWAFEIDETRMDELSEALRERPGPKGWGSGKTIIDNHNWIE
ncbi:MAG: hypothetical protein GVY12_01985 [Bacteroidetes bacterium]|jgi:hypothetical protein|nr:hypothetical protein [Bacteroidota bacterium]